MRGAGGCGGLSPQNWVGGTAPGDPSPHEAPLWPRAPSQRVLQTETGAQEPCRDQCCCKEERGKSSSSTGSAGHQYPGTQRKPRLSPHLLSWRFSRKDQTLITTDLNVSARILTWAQVPPHISLALSHYIDILQEAGQSF